MSGRTAKVAKDWLAIDDEYTCCDCVWWSVAEYEKEPTTELTCGYCRRFPPSCEILGEDDGHGQKLMGNPLCYAGDDVCGEFMSMDGERP